MLIKQVVEEERFLGCCDSKNFCPLLSLCVKSSHRLPLCCSHVSMVIQSLQSNIQFTSGGECKVTKATNITLQSVLSTEGDDGEEEVQRWQMRRERGWSDWPGRSSRESDWSGRSNNAFERSIARLSWKCLQRKWSLIILMNSGTLDLERQREKLEWFMNLHITLHTPTHTQRKKFV